MKSLPVYSTKTFIKLYNPQGSGSNIILLQQLIAASYVFKYVL